MYLIAHVVNDGIGNLQINAMNCATLYKKSHQQKSLYPESKYDTLSFVFYI